MRFAHTNSRLRVSVCLSAASLLLFNHPVRHFELLLYALSINSNMSTNLSQHCCDLQLDNNRTVMLQSLTAAICRLLLVPCWMEVFPPGENVDDDESVAAHGLGITAAQSVADGEYN